jgi:uncharacterized protein
VESLGVELPTEFWQGVEQFNQEQFYACHDTLEALWTEAAEPERTFYQGVLQIAVACYHLGNGNVNGAMILLGEGMNRLRRYQPAYGGVDVAQLLNESTQLLTQLQQQCFNQDIPAARGKVDLPTLKLAQF